MHGDGLTHRCVPWPTVVDGDVFTVEWVIVAGRRFWCPDCGTTVRVAHAGFRRGATFGLQLIAALLRVIAAAPIGAGRDDAHAHDLVHGRPLPVSERARSGRPRWTQLRRWLTDLDALWPSVALPSASVATRVRALLVAFGLGVPLCEVLVRAGSAHAGEVTAM